MGRTSELAVGGGESAMPAASRRNVWVDVCRIMASIVIMFFHFPVQASPVKFVSGALFVEYFFMLTGYFALGHIDRHGGGYDEIYGYMRRFFLRVLPFVVVGVLLHFVADAMTLAPDWKAVAYEGLLLPFETLLLQGTSVFESSYTVLWYLSAVMLCLPVVMRLYERTRGGAWRYLAVVVPLLCCGLAMQDIGTIRVNALIVPVARRAIGGLMLGGLVRILSDGLAARKLSKRLRVALSVGELAALGLAMFLMTRPGLTKSQYDSVTVALLMCSLSAGLSGQTVTSCIPATRLAGWLGPVSLSIYCLHCGVFELAKAVAGHDLGNRLTLLAAGIAVVLSVGLVWAVRKGTAIWKARASRHTASTPAGENRDACDGSVGAEESLPSSMAA